MPSLRRRDARLLLALLALVLVPGLTLAYLGLGSLSAREEGLRTQHRAAATLVRDRLAAELVRHEQELTSAVHEIGERPDRTGNPVAATAWLDALAERAAWIERPFLVEGDSLVTGSLWSNWSGLVPDPLRGLSHLAAGVAEAERAEFAQNDLDAALRHYRRALDHAPARSAAAVFVGSRIGRTLFKQRRLVESIEIYRRVAEEADNARDRITGLPYRVIALVQIADALALLGRTSDAADAKRDLLQAIVDTPWDLADGFGAYLSRALSEPGSADAALVAKGQALAEGVAAVEATKANVPASVSANGGHGAGDGGIARYVPSEYDGVPVLTGHLQIAERPGRVVLGFTLASRVLSDWVSDARAAGDVPRDVTVEILPPARDGSTTSEPLAVVPLLDDVPGWTVALVDGRGRSIRQLVARERWAHGALVVGMLAVMVAGLVLVARTSQRAAELARLKTDFVANVSHELKTPLALIRMFGETLESGIVPDESRRQEFAGVIRRESERLTHLINNVLDLGRIDAGTKRYACAEGDIVDTVRDALDAYRPLFERLGFTVETELPDRPVPLWIDRDAIVQALVNLFQNVIKYSDQPAFVRVSVVADRHWVRVSVADRGIGIAADDLRHIFEPYYRADTGQSARAGSGLGLAIVQHAVAAHGGRVEVTSTPGAGSTFTLLLPVRPSVVVVASADTHAAGAGA